MRISSFISTNSPAIFDAMSWPSTIPYDLMLSLEASQTQEELWLAFKAWARSHRLRLKLQWMSELARNLSKLDDWRSRPHNSDKWGVIKEWLEFHGVEAPFRLPTAPEMPGGKFV